MLVWPWDIYDHANTDLKRGSFGPAYESSRVFPSRTLRCPLPDAERNQCG